VPLPFYLLVNKPSGGFCEAGVYAAGKIIFISGEISLFLGRERKEFFLCKRNELMRGGDNKEGA